MPRDTPRRTQPPKAWTDDETDRLADMIADGWTFGGAARKLQRTRNSCIGRWHNHIRKLAGWQAC